MTSLILSFLAVLVGFIGTLIFRSLSKKAKNNRSDDAAAFSALSYASSGISVVAIFYLFVSSFVVIDPGYRGVVVLFGDIREEVLEEGFHIVNPLASVHEMSVRVEKDSETIPAETSDTQSVQITIITNWRPIPSQVVELYRNYGLNYADKIIPPAVRESVKAEVAKYKVTDLIKERPAVHAAVQNNINTWLNKYGLEVKEAGIADIDFSEKYDSAIEGKQLQEQEALKKKYELDRTITEAQMAAAVAKGEADSRIAKANGEAEALKLAASAEAEALRLRGAAQADYNRQVAQSLNELLIQTEYLKKWDGKLPVYTVGSNTTPMLMLPTK